MCSACRWSGRCCSRAGPTTVAAPVGVLSLYKAFPEGPLFTQYNVAESADVDNTLYLSQSRPVGPMNIGVPVRELREFKSPYPLPTNNPALVEPKPLNRECREGYCLAVHFRHDRAILSLEPLNGVEGHFAGDWVKTLRHLRSLAAIVIFPFSSRTSPVRVTVCAMCGTSLALLLAVNSPVTS